MFNAKDHELPDWEENLDQYRLSTDELEELGKKVTRLRSQAAERAATIKAVGDASHVPRLPLELNRKQLEEYAIEHAKKLLSIENAQLE